MIKAAGFRYIPKGALKIADKASDAVAYLYDTKKGEPAAMVFYGKQSKPVVRCYFIAFGAQTAAQRREAEIVKCFKSRQLTLEYKAKRTAERLAKGRGVEVGQYLVASWGYEQTNVNFYKVEELIGKSMAVVVAVPYITVGNEGAYMSSKVIPAEQPAEGAKSYRVQVKEGRATINGNRAITWDGRPEYVSWYA